MDALACDRAVALLGKTISTEQLVLLRELRLCGLQRVVVALDADAGRNAEAVLNAVQSVVDSVAIAHLPDGDPADYHGQIERFIIEGGLRTSTRVAMHLAGARRRS